MQFLRGDLVRKLRFVLLAATCIPAFALPQACPTTLPSLLALGAGSCTVAGLGTLSNFRFSVSSTNGGSPWTAALSSLGASPGFFTVVMGQPTASGVGSATSSSTYNLAFDLVPPSGNTITGANFSFGYSSGALATPAIGGSEILCLNGVFTAFPPTGCSGTMQTLTVPTFNPQTQNPQNPAAITFSATSADVFVTGTGTGDVISIGGGQLFTITPLVTPTPSPTPAPASLLLALTGMGCGTLYLAWRACRA
jgi:hypothetical protein